MKLKMYAIKDVRVDSFMRPFFVQNSAVMQRALLDAYKDPDSNIAKHPDDYQVFELGEYDQETGLVEPIPPKFLFNCSSLKSRESE